MLPSFISRKSTHALARRDAHLAAGGSWCQGPLSQDIRYKRAQAAAKANARRGTLGRLAITAFILLAMGMAATALHREAELQELERKAEVTPWR